MQCRPLTLSYCHGAMNRTMLYLTTHSITAGYQVLSVTNPSSLPTFSCAMPSGLSFANPSIFGQCVFSPSTPTKLSVYVDDTCEVHIIPIGDSACAEPAAAYWRNMQIKGYYVAPDRIQTSLGPASR